MPSNAPSAWATTSRERVSRLYDRHEHGVVRTHHADYGWRCRDG